MGYVLLKKLAQIPLLFRFTSQEIYIFVAEAGISSEYDHPFPEGDAGKRTAILWPPREQVTTPRKLYVLAWKNVTVTGSNVYSADVPAEIAPELPVPPTTRTLPSDNRVVAWFVRGVLSETVGTRTMEVAAQVQIPVTGLYISVAAVSC